jgi:hypothetical protein
LFLKLFGVLGVDATLAALGMNSGERGDIRKAP